MIAAMLRRHGWILLAIALFAAWQWWRSAPAPQPAGFPTSSSSGTQGAEPHTPPVAAPRAPDAPRTSNAALPAEAHEVLRRIHAGGPFPYRQDGGVFQNRERLLPDRERGWYREYTVDTPGSRDRGARRIVTGGRPPREFWYTADHYRSFRRIDAAAGRAR